MDGRGRRSTTVPDGSMDMAVGFRVGDQRTDVQQGVRDRLGQGALVNEVSPAMVDDRAGRRRMRGGVRASPVSVDQARTCSHSASLYGPHVGLGGAQASCSVVTQVGLPSLVAKGTLPVRSPWLISIVPSTSRGSQKPTNPFE